MDKYNILCKKLLNHNILEILTTYEEYLKIKSNYDIDVEVLFKVKLECGCIMNISYIDVLIKKHLQCNCRKIEKYLKRL